METKFDTTDITVVQAIGFGDGYEEGREFWINDNLTTARRDEATEANRTMAAELLSKKSGPAWDNLDDAVTDKWPDGQRVAKRLDESAVACLSGYDSSAFDSYSVAWECGFRTRVLRDSVAWLLNRNPLVA